MRRWGWRHAGASGGENQPRAAIYVALLGNDPGPVYQGFKLVQNRVGRVKEARFYAQRPGRLHLEPEGLALEEVDLSSKKRTCPRPGPFYFRPPLPKRGDALGKLRRVQQTSQKARGKAVYAPGVYL
ncbi:MAG: hypothetical protein C4298_06130 [Thermus sp.]